MRKFEFVRIFLCYLNSVWKFFATSTEISKEILFREKFESFIYLIHIWAPILYSDFNQKSKFQLNHLKTENTHTWFWFWLHNSEESEHLIINYHQWRLRNFYCGSAKKRIHINVSNVNSMWLEYLVNCLFARYFFIVEFLHNSISITFKNKFENEE